MPARKAASKKRKRAGSVRAASRKAGAGKKVHKKAGKSAGMGAASKASGKKRKVSKTRKTSSTKTSSTRKASKKQSAARRKPAARKSAKKKVAGKAGSRKAAGKSASRKRPGKKGAAKKTAKKAAPKKTSGKKAAAGKTAKKGTSKKKASNKAASRPASKVASKKQPGRSGAALRGKRSREDVLSGPIHGIEPYTMRRGEEYMSPEQLEHFRAILTSWKRELMNEVDRTVHHMQDEAANFPDPNDRATQESEFGLELRTRDRERKLLRKIEAALARIEEGTYGYCDETGEEIGLKRLEARPVATLSLEAQERREMAERQFRDRDDRYR